MQKRIVLFFVVFLYMKTSMFAQWSIQFGADANYWEHTELFGGQLSVGMEYKWNKWGARLSYGVGYGERNRLRKFDQVRFDQNFVVFTNHWQGGPQGFSYNLPSDFARQQQLDLSLLYNLASFSNNCKLNIGVGIFFSQISHYFIMDHVKYDEFIYFGDAYEFDLLLISDQKFYTIGQRTEVNIEIQGRRHLYTPYIALGLGPNYTNFGTVGFRISGALEGWKK